MTFDVFSRMLQFSISPIALISGASLLLLSITNRLGRTIDRSRSLVRELQADEAPPFSEEHREQLRILLQRSSYLRYAVLSLSASVFVSATMILAVFLLVFRNWPLQSFVLLLLFVSVCSICVAVLFLILDVSMGLHAMRLELKRHI